MDRDQILREQTSKEDGIDTSRRVFYTLSPQHSSEPSDSTDTKASKQAAREATRTFRTTKLLCLLIEQLEKRGQLSAQEIDELLLATIGQD